MGVVQAPIGSLLLASRLDVQPSVPMCRLAFEGRILRPVQMPSTARPPSSAGAGSHQAGKGEAPSKTKLQASEGCPAASAAAIVAAAEVPLSLAALRIVRRKWRVGVVERFTPDGTAACICGNTPSAGHSAAPNVSGTTCRFQSCSLVVRGLFKDAQHARRFAGFRVALLQATKEDVERQLEGGEDGLLYNQCLSICLPSLASRHSPVTCRSKAQVAASPETGGECNDQRDVQPVRAPSSCGGDGSRPAIFMRPAVVGAAFGGKGKCHVDLLGGLACADAAVAGGLGTAQFCVALLYCKSCFDKHHSILQL